MIDTKFNHPYETPYQVQLDLMKEIYNMLESDCKIGIFESPTGTGKTLSLICSTMSWLREYKRKVNDGMIEDKLKSSTAADDDDEDEPEWVKKAFQDKVLSEFLGEAQKYEQHLDNVKKQGKMINVEKKHGKVTMHKKRRTVKIEEDIDIESLAPDDYDITNESGYKNGLSKDVEKLLNQYEGSTREFNKQNVHATQINESKVKIFFVSRTHSQLSQFSSQLKLTNFPSSISNLSDERIKYLPLGSRKQLCINESVYKLNDLQAINKECQNKQKEPDRCKYLPNPNNTEDQAKKEHLNDLIMADIYDIEDIHALGEEMCICPYYSTRNDIPIAEIISMPYQLLLQKDTRTVLGFDLKDSIIIIDEAHNLLDTISRIYSSSISLKHLTLIRKALKQYTKKFMFKMSAGNRINIAKLSKLVTILYKFMTNCQDFKSGDTIERNDIFNDEITNLLNIYELENYMIRSKLPFKLESYMEKTIKIDGTDQLYKSTGQPLLFGLKSFLYSLSNPVKSGKFFWDKSSTDCSIKYLLLDPSEDFKEVVEESKCVLLAGGTMEPISEFTDFLVPYLGEDKIRHFACDHVIPDKNLTVFPIIKYNDIPFEFSYQKRNNIHMINNLGLQLCELLKEIPDGAVAFFPSYSYLSEVVKVWEKSGVFEKLKSIKSVFFESKEASVEATLSEYKSSIQLENGGAFLLSVVGGKMSEGINFNDELARAVFMVGLPYPNAFSSDLVAKRQYIESKYIASGSSQSFAQGKSQEFYENLCMKAINQSVGRAIRNIHDYAVIYLVDNRYQQEKIQKKLSQWVRKQLAEPRVSESSRRILDATRLFFKAKE